MHESRLRHHGIVVGGLVHPPSVRARKSARDSFSDYLHSVLTYFVVIILVAWQDLYDLGARKFSVLSTSPLGCLPFSRTIGGGIQRECADEHNQAVQMFNHKLSSQLASLSHQLPDSTLVYADLYDPLIDIILQSKKYETAALCNKLTPEAFVRTHLIVCFGTSFVPQKELIRYSFLNSLINVYLELINF
ncbi:Lipase [Parasponia andersonii]|uniref:Lipase n=1 Tax=Parasponia andersonii TaxID=3476 RepID=A0A2P5DJF6_PARAD|nr:Lipase [Parasponia andersonii]